MRFKLAAYAILATLLAFALGGAQAQNSRFDYAATTVQSSGGNLVPLLAIPGAQVSFYIGCTSLPCSTFASVFTSSSGTNACPSSAQVVLQLSTLCSSSADAQGNFGGWFLPGSYQYVITFSGKTYGPYQFTVGNQGGGALDGLPFQEFRTSVSPDLQVFQRALANCQNQVVNVVWAGDSTTIVYSGDGSGEGPNNPNNRFAEQERLYLQGRCGSHGTGVVPYIKFLINGVSLPNGQYYGPSTGTLTQDSTLGPWHNFGSGNQGVITSATTGSTINWTSNLVSLSEDSANIYCLTGPSYGTWSVVVNPHEPVGSTTVLGTGTCGGNSATPAMSVVNVSGWTSQIVDVHLTCSATPCKMWGIEGVNGTTGVSVHNIAEASGFAEDYTVPNGFATINSISNKSLVHTNFGTNESLTGVDPSVFGAAEQQIVANELNSTPTPSVHIFQYAVCGVSGCPSMINMSSSALTVAQDNSIGFVSITDSWTGHFIPGSFDGDEIHPSDAGALAEWERIKASEIDTESLVGGAANLNGGNNFTGIQNIVSNGDSGYFMITGNISGKNWSTDVIDASTGTNAGDYIIFHRPATIPFHLSDAGIMSPNDAVVGFSPGSKALVNPGLIDSAISRGGAPGKVYVGNGTPGDFSGTLAATHIISADIETITATAPTGACGPNGSISLSTDGKFSSCVTGGWNTVVLSSGFITPTSVAPTGACPIPNTWIFSADGHVTFCAGGTWVTKI